MFWWTCLLSSQSSGQRFTELVCSIVKSTQTILAGSPCNNEKRAYTVLGGVRCTAAHVRRRLADSGYVGCLSLREDGLVHSERASRSSEVPLFKCSPGQIKKFPLQYSFLQPLLFLLLTFQKKSYLRLTACTAGRRVRGRAGHSTSGPF